MSDNTGIEWADATWNPGGEPCRNTIQPNQPLPGRSVHFGRLVDRSRQKGDDE